uniref:SAM-dependent methyltransferase n=1 Tax=Paractinoplanes polyasparticus TaxID=2856853 RepID=UPI001C8549A9|nr:class I SAM-dependent methyltransferase [Actinoplanes polyasparticus]
MALSAAGVLESDSPGQYRLSTTYAPLLQHGADKQFANLLAGTAVRARLLERMFTPEAGGNYQDLTGADRLALAASVTLAPSTPLAMAAMSQVAQSITPWQEMLNAGDVRYLELGCGVSGAMLTMLQLHPRLTAVGIDLAGDLIDRARAEAVALGVADRVRFGHGDAATFSDPEPFDAVFWSQYFFPAGSRALTLANAYERLRSGGLLVTPVLHAGPADPVHPLNVALYQSWGIPVLTTEELCTELEEAGFAAPTACPGPVTPFVVARRP